MTKRRLWTALVLAALLGTYLAWPYLFLRPALLADARNDVHALSDIAAADEVTDHSLPVGKVVVLSQRLRVRVVSDSHHNNFIGYSGSTYVNVNNRVFYRSGGYCAPEWLAGTVNWSEMTEESLVAMLLERGYRQLGGR